MWTFMCRSIALGTLSWKYTLFLLLVRYQGHVEHYAQHYLRAELWHVLLPPDGRRGFGKRVFAAGRGGEP